MRRLSSYFFALCLAAIFILSSPGPAPGYFSDIRDHWAEQQIKYWFYQGFCAGYPDGKFRPNELVTRAEFVAMVNKSFKLSEKKPPSFSDVTHDNWFYDEIARAKSAGYIFGYGDGTFRPQAKIERQEAAAIIFRLLDPGEKDYNSAIFSDDSEIAGWAREAVDAASHYGYMSGYPDSSFKPLAGITRGEAISALDRAKIAVEIIKEENKKAESGEHSYWISHNDWDDHDWPDLPIIPPVLLSATVVIDGVPMEIPLSGGLNVYLDLSPTGLNLSPDARLNTVILVVSRDCLLNITLPPPKILGENGLPLSICGENGITLDLLSCIKPTVSQRLKKGTNQLAILQLMSMMGLKGDGISLKTMKLIFGETATFTGNIQDITGTYNFSLTIKYP